MSTVKYILHVKTLFKIWLLTSLMLNVLQHPNAVKATDDIVNVSPYEMETILSQLINPSPQYQMHVNALRQQLRNLLQDRLLAEGEEQHLNNDYQDYQTEDKRSVAALAAQGLLQRHNKAEAAAKRSLATLAKNGQLPTAEPNLLLDDDERLSEEKRYLASLARSNNMLGYGKRNIGTLARDFQLPPSGKRNMATMARLGWLGKRNLASVARFNSQRYYDNAAEKRNLAALRNSPVHGGGYYQQKRADAAAAAADGDEEEEEEVYIPAVYNYVDPFAQYWDYGTYADLDWGDFGRAQKRFLDDCKERSRQPQLFDIEYVSPYYITTTTDNMDETAEDEQQNEIDDEGEDDASSVVVLKPSPKKRHIGAVYRSGFLPSYRALRSFDGYGGDGGVGRFSRSGRARQFVGYYPQHERLHQPVAAVCKRCFIPYRPNANLSPYARRPMSSIARQQREQYVRSIVSNHIPSTPTNSLRHPAALRTFGPNSWDTTPPQPREQYRRSSLRKHDPIDILRKTLYASSPPPLPQTDTN